jgi:hypothetical protein
VRLACPAYRAKGSEGASDHEAHLTAVAAVQSVLPLPWKEDERAFVDKLLNTPWVVAGLKAKQQEGKKRR